MFVLLGVMIRVVFFFIMASLVAIPFAVLVYWRSKNCRKRKALLALISPYLFVYTSYACYLLGAFYCSPVFNTGCGTDGYWHTELSHGYEMYSVSDNTFSIPLGIIYKGDSIVVDDVTKIKEEGNMLYGLTSYIIDDSKGYFFSLNMETGALTWHGRYAEVKKENADITSGLMNTESFYYDKWPWVTPLEILSILLGTGIVYGLWQIFFHLCRKEGGDEI